MISPPNLLEQLLYNSFSNVFEARLKMQEYTLPAAGELKALEDRLWRLFIRCVHRDPRVCFCETAA